MKTYKICFLSEIAGFPAVTEHLQAGQYIGLITLNDLDDEAAIMESEEVNEKEFAQEFRDLKKFLINEGVDIISIDENPFNRGTEEGQLLPSEGRL